MMLVCDSCGGAMVHIFKTEVFRRGEDKPSSALNPSLRRSGVRITVQCERCDSFTDLTVAEHKGQVFVNSVPAEV